jgi:hypothetical protein
MNQNWHNLATIQSQQARSLATWTWFNFKRSWAHLHFNMHCNAAYSHAIGRIDIPQICQLVYWGNSLGNGNACL